MKTTILTLTVLLVAMGLGFAACAGREDASGLRGHSWKLLSYGPVNNPTPAVPDARTGLIFGEDGQLSGNVGCNSLGGAYTVRGSQVTFEQIVSTMMACSEPLMQQESAVFSVLAGTVTFKIEGSTLIIYDKGGANALRFVAEAGQ